MAATVFPHTRLFSDVNISVTSIRMDNSRLPDYHIDSEGKVVSLFSVERQDWNFVDFDVTVEVSLQELKSKDIDDRRTRALFRINCDSTNFRTGAIETIRDGRANCTISIGKAPLARKATLQCFIVRDGEDGIARILKEADEWSLVLNGPQVRQISTRKKGGLQEFADIRWVDFSDSSLLNGALSAYAKEAYYIDVSAESPTLYLNKSIEHYETLLSENSGASKAEKAFRDLEFRRISLGVWLAFAYEAVSQVNRDPSTNELSVPDGWRMQVLNRLLPKLFPGESIDSAISKLATLRAAGTADAIAGKMQIAINEIVGTSATLRRQMQMISED